MSQATVSNNQKLKSYGNRIDSMEVGYAAIKTEAAHHRRARNLWFAAFGALSAVTHFVSPQIDAHPSFIEKAALDVPQWIALYAAFEKGSNRRRNENAAQTIGQNAISLSESLQIVPPAWAFGKEVPQSIPNLTSLQVE